MEKEKERFKEILNKYDDIISFEDEIYSVENGDVIITLDYNNSTNKIKCTNIRSTFDFDSFVSSYPFKIIDILLDYINDSHPNVGYKAYIRQDVRDDEDCYKEDYIHFCNSFKQFVSEWKIKKEVSYTYIEDEENKIILINKPKIHCEYKQGSDENEDNLCFLDVYFNYEPDDEQLEILYDDFKENVIDRWESYCLDDGYSVIYCDSDYFEMYYY